MAERKTTQAHLDYAADLIDKVKEKAPIRLLDEDGNLIKRDFLANGRRYVILKHEDCFNVARMKAHLLLEQMFGAAKSLEQLVRDNIKSVELMDGYFFQTNPLSDLVVHLKKIAKNYFEDNLKRDHIAFYQCTLFVVREDDDLTDWSLSKADEYIEDWTKTNIYAPDLFQLALASFPNFIRTYMNQTEIISQVKSECENKKKKQKGEVGKKEKKGDTE